AVVVGDQDPGPAIPFAQRPGAAADGPRATPCRAPRDGLAALLVEVAPLGPCPFPGHVRLVVAHVTASAASPGSAGSGPGSSTSAAVPGAGSRGTRTGRPSRSETRFAARPATVRSPDER